MTSILCAPLALAAALAGCRSRNDGATSTPAHAVSFRSDIVPVIEHNCATAEGCHGDKPTDSVALDLRPGAAYAQLVGARAEARKGALRVKAGDPSMSFLVDKLMGTLGAQEGKPMPIDATTGAPIDPSPLTPDFIEKVLKPWIRAGALDN